MTHTFTTMIVVTQFFLKVNLESNALVENNFGDKCKFQMFVNNFKKIVANTDSRIDLILLGLYYLYFYYLSLKIKILKSMQVLFIDCGLPNREFKTSINTFLNPKTFQYSNLCDAQSFKILFGDLKITFKYDYEYSSIKNN